MAEVTETIVVQYCDSCSRKSSIPLTKCPICHRENCYTCSSQLYDVWHTNICKKCLEDETVHAYFMDNWKHWGVERNKVIKEMVGRFGSVDSGKEKE